MITMVFKIVKERFWIYNCGSYETICQKRAERRKATQHQGRICVLDTNHILGLRHRK